MSTNKIVCPNCGTEITITPEQSAVLVSKAHSRIEALRNAGVKGQFFAMSDGNISMFDVQNACIKILDSEDDIFKSIVEEGTINNKNLFRRFVAAQMLRMLGSSEGYTAYLHNLGYKYQWKMLLEEARQQKSLYHSDREYFDERNLLFDCKKVAIACAEDYINKLQSFVSLARTHRCHGRLYKRIGNRNVFVDSIENEVFQPLYDCKYLVEVCENINHLVNAIEDFMSKMIFIRKFRQNRTWVDAYKGAGAYYTLKNLVLFSNVKIYDSDNNILRREKASKYLYNKAVEYSNDEGWRLMGLLKKTLKNNNIDIHLLRASWRKN